MKNLLLILLLVLFYSSSNAQFTETKLEGFTKGQILLDKVKNQEYFDGMGHYHTVIRQVFSENSIAVIEKRKGNKKGEKYGDKEEIERYSNIPWNNIRSYNFYQVQENDKLIELTLFFVDDLTVDYEYGDLSDTETTKIVSLIILKNDSQEMEMYIQSIRHHSEKI